MTGMMKTNMSIKTKRTSFTIARCSSKGYCKSLSPKCQTMFLIVYVVSIKNQASLSNPMTYTAILIKKKESIKDEYKIH